MWLFLADSFLSVVAHRERPDCLLVRSRIRGDIEALIPEAEVTESEDADYRFRAVVLREAVANAAAQRILAIAYPNFKNSVASGERHRAAVGVWQAVADVYGSHGSPGRGS